MVFLLPQYYDRYHFEVQFAGIVLINKHHSITLAGHSLGLSPPKNWTWWNVLLSRKAHGLPDTKCFGGTNTCCDVSMHGRLHPFSGRSIDFKGLFNVLTGRTREKSILICTIKKKIYLVTSLMVSKLYSLEIFFVYTPLNVSVFYCDVITNSQSEFKCAYSVRML